MYIFAIQLKTKHLKKEKMAVSFLGIKKKLFVAYTLTYYAYINVAIYIVANEWSMI